jgi:hypothetical protein
MTWFDCIENFKHDFEMRRIIFGLAGVVKGNPASIPDLVKQKVGYLGLQMSKLVVRMGCERERIIKKHKIYIENDGNEEKIEAQMMQQETSGEEDSGFESESSDEDGEDENYEILAGDED